MNVNARNLPWHLWQKDKQGKQSSVAIPAGRPASMAGNSILNSRFRPRFLTRRFQTGMQTPLGQKMDFSLVFSIGVLRAVYKFVWQNEVLVAVVFQYAVGEHKSLSRDIWRCKIVEACFVIAYFLFEGFLFCFGEYFIKSHYFQIMNQLSIPNTWW